MALVSVKLDRAAADELRAVKAQLGRGADRVPTLSDVIRALAARWRESQADASPSSSASPARRAQADA